MFEGTSGNRHEKDQLARGLFNARITTFYLFTAAKPDVRMVRLLESREKISRVISSNVLSTNVEMP